MFDITTLILFALATLGMTSIIVGGKIFIPVRDLFANAAENVRSKRENQKHGWTFVETVHEIINCNHCCGFWTGLFCGFLLLNAPAECTCRNFRGLFFNFEDAFSNFEPNIWWIVFNQFIRYLGLLFCCGAAGSFLALSMQFVYDFLHVNTIRFQPPMDEPELDEESD